MSVLMPKHRFKRVWEIQPEWLEAQGITALLLDVDNTLTTHDNPVVPDAVTQWIADMKQAGVALYVLSNNKRQRVEPFAEKLGLRCISRAAKPLTAGVRRAQKRLQVEKGQIGVVGDQIFTDILCANLAHVHSILVEPMEMEPFLFFKFKRFLERLVLRK